jgi:hypothetical protein
MTNLKDACIDECLLTMQILGRAFPESRSQIFGVLLSQGLAANSVILLVVVWVAPVSV